MSQRFPRDAVASLCVLLLAAVPAALAGSPSTVTSSRDLEPSQPLDVVLYDRTSGRTLPLHAHRGELYVAGEPGHEYEVRLRNPGQRRVLAVTSVDGVNVVTGRTAATDQPGYVLDGWGSARIDGWRKNLGEVASFVFTTPRRSYAARTGRPDHVGVIGVAMFLEAPRRGSPASPTTQSSAAATDAESGSAASAEGLTRRDRAEAKSRTHEPSLGTGHGARRDSPVSHTTFERASATPDAVVRIYYDSWRQLVARGVIVEEVPFARRRPEAFPGGFVPDP